MPLPPTFPDLVSLDLFVSVVDLGSVSRAAAAHGISQPSASARIAGLERSLGMTLLYRAPNGSVPTREGALLADWVGQLLTRAEDLDAGIQSLRPRRGRRVRVAATQTMAELLIPGWLVGVRDRYPSAPVELATMRGDGVLTQVREAKADLGFTESAGAAAGLSTAVVGTDRLVAVVDPDHPWARRRGLLSASTLATTPLVARPPGSATRDAFEEALRQAGLRAAPPALELGPTAAVKAAVIAGRAPAVLSRMAVEAEVASGRLVIVDVDGLDLERRLRAVWSPARVPDGPAGDLLAVARRAGRAAEH